MNSKRLIIAEVGSVHDGSFGNACKLIEAVKNTGANAIKFQTHLAEHETLKNAPNPSYFTDENRYDYFVRTSFSKKQWVKLKNLAKSSKLIFISSVFSIESFNLLYSCGIKNIKIPSGEVSNISLLEAISSKKDVNVILSCGMSNYNEIDNAFKILKNNNLSILQCTSEYPCSPKNVGLNVIEKLKKRYKIDIGFSDHTLGFAASFAATALGANIIEKHFTFSRLMYGSDAKNAMEPEEFTQFVRGIKEIWSMIDNPVDKKISYQIKKMKDIFEKSIVTKVNLKKGDIITLDKISFKKPGTGINSSDYKKILNKRIKVNKKINTIIKWKDII